MILQLYFDPTKIPRTISRQEWKLCWRWIRVCRNTLELELVSQIDRLAIFGTTMPIEMLRRELDDIINPPLLLGPYMDGK